MSIAEKEQEIVDEFNSFDDWDGKYEYLIDLGKELPVIEEQYKIQKRRI
jgi:cysteine desulfuration protein SufE